MSLPIIPMSKSGDCARTLSAMLLGKLDPTAVAPIYLQRAAREGQRHEAWIRYDLEHEHGYKISAPVHCEPCGREGIHVEYTTANWKAVGHLDGLAFGDKAMILEMKALGKFTFEKYKRYSFEAFRGYASQITFYHLAYPIGSVPRWPILYVVKSRDSGEMAVKELDGPPNTFGDMVKRIDMIVDFAMQGELCPCDVDITGISGKVGGYSCTPLCRERDTATYVKDSTLLTAGQSWAKLKELKDELDITEGELKLLFETALGQTDANKLIIPLSNDDAETGANTNVVVSQVPAGKRRVYSIPNEIKNKYMEEKPRAAYIKIEVK